MKRVLIYILAVVLAGEVLADGVNNLLNDPEFARINEDGTLVKWGGDGGVHVGMEDGVRIVTLDAGALRSTMEQAVRLSGRQLYRLSVECKGTVGGRIRARSQTGERQAKYFDASEDWTRHELAFIPPADGRWSIILDTLETGPTGQLAARGLTLVREATAEVAGRAIPVPVDGAAPFLVTHIPVADCRAVRGFFGAPIDGTTASMDYSGKRWEYNYQGEQANAAVRYLYRGNDGLHVTLADGAGVDAIQVQGGVKAAVVVDCRQYDDPASGREIHAFPGGANNSLAYFDQRVATDRVSFFNVGDGYIADLCLFRCGGDVSTLGTPEGLAIGGEAEAGLLGPFLEARFEEGSRGVVAAVAGTSVIGAPLELRAGQAVQVLAGPWDEDYCLSGVGLQGGVGGATGAVPLTVQVQDAVHPRTAVTTAMLELAGPGRLDLALDIPDQVIPKGWVRWVTLIPRGDFTLTDAQLVLYRVPRWQALPGALAYRLTKLKGFWAILSEARPWNSMRRGEAPEDWLARVKDESDRRAVIEIRDAIEACSELHDDDPIVTQYREWFYRGSRRPALPPAKIADDPGAPEWAIVARTAWLEARSVAGWWVENRLAASGEFGGSDDDGSMYQNFGNFPMFESDGVGGALKEGAARRAELDQAVRLDQGLGRTTEDPLHFYEDGLNQQSLVTWWHYGDPVYIERCMLTAKNLEKLTLVNAVGHRHFKGDVFGSAFLRAPESQPVNFDSGFSAQVMHPVCELAIYNRNPRATQFLRELGGAWAEHTVHAAPGAYPMGVDSVSDAVVDSSPEPYASGFGCHASMMQFYARVTGEYGSLQPMVDYFATGEYGESTLHYLPDLFQMGCMDASPDSYRTQFGFAPALEWLATGNKAPFLAALKADIAEIQTFRHMYTAVEPFTDRVFLYAAINPALAYTGGFTCRNKTYHSHAVSWAGFGTNYAALVRAGRADRLHAMVYNFSEQPLQGTMRCWTLAHGRYDLGMGVDTNGDDVADGDVTTERIEVVRGDGIVVELPPRQTTVVTLTQVEELEPVELRADLALSPREILVSDGVVQGVAHNIGSRDVDAVAVELVDAAGRVQQRQGLGNMAAPVDLEPVRVAFRFDGVPAEHGGWRVVLKADGEVEEIFGGNNAVGL